jgi:hypothetical protein
VHSAAPLEFSSTDEARPALIDWARVHAVNERQLSPGRAVILSPWADRTHRLWQLVRLQPSLRERLDEGFEVLPASALAGMLLQAASHLVRAHKSLREAGLAVRCSLWSVSAQLDHPPVYLGLLPPQTLGEPMDCADTPDQVVEREFLPWMQACLDRRPDRDHVARDLCARARGSIESERMILMRAASAWTRASDIA